MGETELGANDLKFIPLERRLCVTDDEISLKYFEDYTGPYCQLDCLTKLLYADCGCIPYYYPGKWIGQSTGNLSDGKLPLINLLAGNSLPRASSEHRFTSL